MGIKIEAPTFTLNNSALIPALGFGSHTVEKNHDIVKAATLKALESGYRHIDTASSYGTEVGVGNALQEAFVSGLVKREEVFVTTKISTKELHTEEILPAIHKSLSNLQLSYIDLYLIHWPVRLKHGANFLAPSNEDFLPLDFKDTWEALEKLVELGLTKSIGVSNFCVKRLQELLANAKFPPAVNQVELHPQWRQEKLRAFCHKKGIHVTAYSPLGAPGVFYGGFSVMNNPVLKEIADKHGKSVAQICLRWIHEQGASSVPKSFNEGRLMENMSIWNFNLTEEDHQMINSIEQSKFVTASFLFKGCPWHTFEKFWDDDE